MMATIAAVLVIGFGMLLIVACAVCALITALWWLEQRMKR